MALRPLIERLPERSIQAVWFAIQERLHEPPVPCLPQCHLDLPKLALEFIDHRL